MAEPQRDDSASGPETRPAEEAPSLPALVLREGLPPVTASPTSLHSALARLESGTGPLAVDTERASGYRYSQRAYLVQLRRERSGTVLIDPVALPDLSQLACTINGLEWILHSASQDLPCLAEVGLHPREIFDTELAGRLLGMERVGLAAMVEHVLGHTLAKGHGAADWSTRPLPVEWLEYAALDVEVLIELRARLRDDLAQSGKLGWAEQEFAAIRDAVPPPRRADPWRRTSGIHRVRSRRGLAIVEQLWLTRDCLAESADVAPGRLLPDSAIIAAAQELARDGPPLRRIPRFRGRGAARHHRDWAEALRAAWELAEGDLPVSASRSAGPPPARSWAQRDPEAAARLSRARAALGHRADRLGLPVENLVTPELVRRMMWHPPASGTLAEALAAAGARPWQVELVADVLEEAVRPVSAPG